MSNHKAVFGRGRPRAAAPGGGAAGQGGARRAGGWHGVLAWLERAWYLFPLLALILLLVLSLRR